MPSVNLKQALLRWYGENKRNLPWRMSRDPYFIWISEIMLQQTTVKAVIPFYNKFIENFPTVLKLANAKEEKVLSLWSGLGYYSRARNLQKAAKNIVHRGAFPKTFEALLTLPGIGPYTAAAIASIAFGEEVAAIDGNVIRVISRLFDIEEDVNSKVGKTKIFNHASDLISGQNPSDHNQAMMELGATLCTSKSPSCLICPLRDHCLAFKNKSQSFRPVKKKKATSRAVALGNVFD